MVVCYIVLHLSNHGALAVCRSTKTLIVHVTTLFEYESGHSYGYQMLTEVGFLVSIELKWFKKLTVIYRLVGIEIASQLAQLLQHDFFKYVVFFDWIEEMFQSSPCELNVMFPCVSFHVTQSLGGHIVRVGFAHAILLKTRIEAVWNCRQWASFPLCTH